MIEIQSLTKHYGTKTAVSDLTFTVRPGTVTGFLGPNGAGKSTTMRMILGLDEPASGSVTVNGQAPRALTAPLREIGGMLDTRAVHPSRSAYHHLLALAQTCGIPGRRVREVIESVGLGEAARRRAGKFSLGMSQRLGIAAALLGDPATVVLDEPVNGLDVDGIRWIRGLLRDLADQGKTVFVSSHLMSEIAQTATHVIVIGRGRLHRRHHRRRPPRLRPGRRCPGPQHRPGRPGRAAARAGHHHHPRRRRRHDRGRPDRQPDRRCRGLGRHHRPRAGRRAGLAGGRIRAPDPGRGGVPRPVRLTAPADIQELT